MTDTMTSTGLPVTPLDSSAPKPGASPFGPGQPTGTFPAGQAMANSNPVGLSSIQTQHAIAYAISKGLEAVPDSDAGWQSLFQKYGNPLEQNSLNAGSALEPLTGIARGGTSSSFNGTGSPPTGAVASGDLESFLNAIKTHESGGNYTANNTKGGATGAYQFIQSTWNSNAVAAGYGQYAGQPASAAPPQVQDAVAAHMAQQYFNQYGNWSDVAQAWYDPALVGKNVVPDPQAGNTETVTQYGQQITDMMNAKPGSAQDFQVAPVQTGSNTALTYARQQLGTPYVWGGEQQGVGFDCSGLVQASFAKAGIKLPRTAQQQYDATMRVPDGQPPQPGDLVFFGQGPNQISHVGIYIGNGQMIDAPHTGAQVRIENYQWSDYVGATRPGDPTGQTIVPAATQAQPGQVNTDMTTGAFNQALTLVQNSLRSIGAG